MLDAYQVDSYNGIRDAMNVNKWNKVLLALPTGSGKSHISLEFIKGALAKKKRVGFFVDRIVLGDQFASMCLDAGIDDFSIMQADNPLYRPHCPFQIISAQTLARRDIEELDLAIYDECFPGNVEILTEQGFVRFNQLSEDVKVAQYENGAISFVKPDAYIKKIYNGNLIRIYSDDLLDIPMTENHELLINWNGTDRKITAKEINFSYLKRLYTAGKAIGENDALTTRERLAIATQADGSIHCESSKGTTIDFNFSKERKIERFLDLMNLGGFEFREMKGKPANGNIKAKRRFMVYNLKGITKDLFQHFDLSRIGYIKAINIIEEMKHWDGSILRGNGIYFSSVEKRQADFYQAVAILAGYKTNLTIEVDNRKETYRDCYRLFILTDRDYIGTGCLKKENIGYNDFVYCVSVKSGNIIVRNNGKPLVIGNCHVVYKTLVDRMREWKKTYWIGLTATPYTRGLGKIWNGMVSKIKMYELIEQGYLADFEFYSRSQTAFDVTGIPIVKGEYEEKALGQRAAETGKKRIGNILDHWFEYANGFKTIMRCVDIPDSEFMAKEFKDAGVKADFIHSYLRPEEIKRKLTLFRENEITVMLQVAMFTRGFDMPDCKALIDGKPSKSMNDWIQFIGRGARGGWRRNGKDKCVVFDHALNCKRHNTFPHWVEPDELDMGERKKDKEPYKKQEKKVAECSKCGLAFEWIGENFKCPKCGRAPMRKPLIDVVDGKLTKMNSHIAMRSENLKNATTEDKDRLYAKLRAGANAVGFKEGWAYWKYKEYFGVGPARKVEPDKGFYDFLKNQDRGKAVKIIFSLVK